MNRSNLLAHTTDCDEPFCSLKGHNFHIRPLERGDREALDEFVRNLSPRSRRLRFFSGMKGLAPKMLDHLLDVDGCYRAAFIASLDGVPGIQAVGRYEWTSPGVAEVAFTVADRLQGEGIGTELLFHLAAHARKNGIMTFLAYVLFENQQMFDVFRHSGFPMSSECDAGVSLVTLSLAE